MKPLTNEISGLAAVRAGIARACKDARRSPPAAPARAGPPAAIPPR